MLNKIPILTYCLLTIGGILAVRLILHKTAENKSLIPYVKYVNLIRFSLTLFFSGILTMGISVAVIGTQWFVDILLPLLILPSLLGYILVLLWLKFTDRFGAIAVFQARYESSNVKRSEKTGRRPSKTNPYFRLLIDCIGFPLNLSALFIAMVFAAPATLKDRECARLVSKEFNQGLRQSSYRLFLEKPIAGKAVIRIDHFDPLHYRNTGDSICAVSEIGIFGFKRVVRYESP